MYYNFEVDAGFLTSFLGSFKGHLGGVGQLLDSANIEDLVQDGASLVCTAIERAFGDGSVEDLKARYDASVLAGESPPLPWVRARSLVARISLPHLLTSLLNGELPDQRIGELRDSALRELARLREEREEWGFPDLRLRRSTLVGGTLVDRETDAFLNSAFQRVYAPEDESFKLR